MHLSISTSHTSMPCPEHTVSEYPSSSQFSNRSQTPYRCYHNRPYQLEATLESSTPPALFKDITAAPQFPLLRTTTFPLCTTTASCGSLESLHGLPSKVAGEECLHRRLLILIFFFAVRSMSTRSFLSYQPSSCTSHRRYTLSLRAKAS